MSQIRQHSGGRKGGKVQIVTLAVFYALAGIGAFAHDTSLANNAKEGYIKAPMPPGFQVIITELEGPVYADSKRRTLYRWPRVSLRNGYVGDPKGKSTCTDEVLTTGAGLMSPYPPGLVLPELDKRPSCSERWPPALAASGAVPVGDWTLIMRADGAKQWAYNGQALYTSALDQRPGDTWGGSNRRETVPAPRRPVGPSPNVPPGFTVATTFKGRLVVNDEGYSVYVSEEDGPNRSNCYDGCAQIWIPVVASALAQESGEWTIFERAPGVRQWAYRKQPLYTHARDINLYGQHGSDVPGWSNVYTHRVPEPPSPFTRRYTQSGVVVADSNGKTVYIYRCADDSLHQLLCDYPGAPAAYRLAICGGGDVDRCLARWPYVRADASEQPNSQVWSIMVIDPRTGNPAREGQAGVQRVWAYRGRPIYTFADEEPGEIKGADVGEWRGARNGFSAMWVRDDFFGNDT